MKKINLGIALQIFIMRVLSLFHTKISRNFTIIIEQLKFEYSKLAHKHYGDSSLWWVIAWFNKRPTESHVTVGTVIVIPMPIQKVLKYLRNE